MIDAIILFFKDPLRGIVSVLCLVVFALSLTMTNVQAALAVIEVQQVEDATINAQVLEMAVVLGRIDENIENLQQGQERTLDHLLKQSK